MMVDPSSHLFICQGKQVLPLPFSFVSLHKTDLETSFVLLPQLLNHRYCVLDAYSGNCPNALQMLRDNKLLPWFLMTAKSSCETINILFVYSTASITIAITNSVAI